MFRFSIIPVLMLFVVTTFLFSQQYRGEIVGTVFDAKTRTPLPFVNIQLVEQPTLGTVTDTTGFFLLRSVPVGTYSIKASLLGYQPSIITNVVVSTGRSAKVVVYLSEQILSSNDVTVQATYFAKSNELAPVSINNYDRAEVKRQPGSIGDVQRVIQNLPGIANSSDFVNELIVRGGAPHENLTIVENMEIPSINHYSNEFNSAGPINMINIDLVEDVQFMSGAFPAQYGDKISSVMDISIREGDRQKTFASNTGIHMAGVGTLMEGCINNGQGSWIFSARMSLLEVIDKVIGMSAFSLTAIPKYWDMQTKIVYDLSPNWKLAFNALYGDSRILERGTPSEEIPLKASVTDTTSIYDYTYMNKNYVFGINLKHLWGEKGFSVLTLYSCGSRFDTDVYESFTERTYNETGKLVDYRKLTDRTIFGSHIDEAYYALKYEAYYIPFNSYELLCGTHIQVLNHWMGSTSFSGEVERFDLDGDGVFETGPFQRPDGNYLTSLRCGDVTKYALYCSNKIRIFPQLTATIGLRYDYFSYSEQGQISPRFALAYELIPSTTTLSIAAGEYYQTQPLPYYSDRQNTGINRKLPNAQSRHYVAGIQHLLEGGIKMSVEAYYKKFNKLAVEETFIHSADETFWSDKILAVGSKKSYGIDFLLQKKQVENYYGTISVSFSKTVSDDPRIPKLASSFPSNYDYPVIINIISGKVAKGWRSWLDEQPWFLKYPSYLFPFSDEMELSFRYRYQSGGPYTPQYFSHTYQYWEGDTRWSQGAWKQSSAINSLRYPSYSRLDIQFISRYYMNNWNINVYLALMNVLNSKNVAYYEHLSDGTIETVYQYGFFPVLGIEIEF